MGRPPTVLDMINVVFVLSPPHSLSLPVKQVYMYRAFGIVAIGIRAARV